MTNPYAYFDVLFIGKKLQQSYGNFAASEVHLFAYLSCLLSLYKQRPIADWGYQFAVTAEGSPFSTAVDDSISVLTVNGLIQIQDNFLRLTELSAEEYDFLASLSQNIERLPFLEGACSSILALPIGVVRDAILHEPELGRASRLSATRMLLEGPGLQLLYDQFIVLSNAIGVEKQDLIIPSVIWLTYLSQASQSQPHTIKEEW